MKKIILIGGTMGVGKTTVCQKLKYELDHSVFLDGDWCWDMHPFVVNEETKTMVMNHIVYQLNSFIHCSCIEHIIFCWVMHEQSIIDEIVSRLDTDNCRVYCISLVCSPAVLTNQIQKDISQGIRHEEVLQRSLERLSCYDCLKTIKVDKTNLSLQETVDKIKTIVTA